MFPLDSVKARYSAISGVIDMKKNAIKLDQTYISTIINIWCEHLHSAIRIVLCQNAG